MKLLGKSLSFTLKNASKGVDKMKENKLLGEREQAIIREVLLLRLLALVEGYDFKLIKLKNQHAYRVKLIKPKNKRRENEKRLVSKRKRRRKQG